MVKGALAMSVAPESGQNRIMIYGPKNDGTYIVEFTTAAGEALAISVPAGDSRPVCLLGCLCRTFREEHSLRLGCFR